MIDLYDAEKNTRLGTISETQLRFLMNQLEEESSDDRDYYIDAATIKLLEEDGADAPLLKLLRDALGSREGIEIRWSQASQWE